MEDADEGVNHCVCLVGDLDDAISGVNGANIASQMRLMKSLIQRLMKKGRVVVVLDDNKASATRYLDLYTVPIQHRL